MLEEKQARELIGLAEEASKMAYADYSGIRVGAALATSSGGVFSGCNVENASYGLTVCAERNAIQSAVMGGMQKGNLAAIAVVSPNISPIAPCGACRQVIFEFAAPDCVVLSVDRLGGVKQTPIKELLPGAFDLAK